MRAISALAAEIPVKPNSAATSEMTRNISAHFRIDMVFVLENSKSSNSPMVHWFRNFLRAASLQQARAGWQPALMGNDGRS